ncbi:MAG: histidinol phosphate phosphatase [Deltaproteobacteria bacterium]|nr:histidinol phosphate phosphatase [Deltaproteobacteria bacterium]
MSLPYADELAAARRAADDAGRFALAHFKTRLAVEAKADGSPVTLADRGAEEILRRELGGAFPADGVLGEELGETRGASGRRWIIDPIDGTQSFIRGVPLWGVLVALEDRGECVLGVVALPALGEALWAVRGQGAFLNGAPARVAATALADATICTSDASPRHFGGKHAGFERLLRAAARHRGWGDCYGYALVATGRAEVMLDPLMNPWDAAAVKPIVEEAGGCFCAWDGTPTVYGGSALAMPAALRGEVLGLLDDAPRTAR